jgi:serine protease Do
MPRCGWLLLAVVLVGAGLRGQDGPDEIRALDRAFQKTIARFDRCVVCILVSRDEGYDRFEEKKNREPGELGKFDAAALLLQVGEKDLATRRRIAELDLTAQAYVPESTATGLIIDKAGLILVPAHAVSRAKKLYVKLPGNKGSFADIHALDPRADLAVLRLLDPPEGLQAAALGDGGSVAKGQFVLLLGNPFAPGFREQNSTASWGMVANVRQKLPLPRSEPKGDFDRSLLTLHHHGALLQVESRLNLNALTCNGGVVLNLDGEAVGLMTAYPAVAGGEIPGGFAVPFNEGMRRIIEVLRKGEEVEYGFLGVGMDTRFPGGGGAVVSSVTDGSPAKRAKLIKGDTIVRIDGQAVTGDDDLFLMVGTKLAGNTIKVEFVRDRGLAPPVAITLAKFLVHMPGRIASRQPAPAAGLRVDWTSIMAQRGGGEIPPGVVVREVVPDSPAARASLRVDMVITHVAGKPVLTPAEFYRAMADTKGPVKVLVKDVATPFELTR